MAAYQTTYGNTFAKGFPGMIANGETSNRISRIVEQAGGIGFGKAAYRSSDTGVDTTEATANLLGFTIASYAPAAAQATGDVTDTHPQGSTIGILTLGCMWVETSVAVNDGEQVYVTSAGDITNVSTSNQAATGWFFQDTIGSAGLARIARR